MNAQLNGITLKLLVGDLLAAEVDAIVVTATPDLSLQTDIGQKLLLQAGVNLQEECRAIGYCEAGQVALTSGGNLPARHIIHAVGPTIGSGNERGKLSSAVWNALRLAVNQNFSVVTFSAISVGQFGYPVEGCAAIMAQKLVDFTFEELGSLNTLSVILPDSNTYTIFEQAFRKEVETALNEVSTGH